MKETPRPLVVRAMMTDGLPFAVSAHSRASQMLGMLFPSMLLTAQPKLSQRSSKGSSSFDDSGESIALRPFLSMIATRLSNDHVEDVMAASHTWPSCSSPSPRRQ